MSYVSVICYRCGYNQVSYIVLFFNFACDVALQVSSWWVQ